MLHVLRERRIFLIPKVDLFHIILCVSFFFFFLSKIALAVPLQSKLNINCGSNRSLLLNDSTEWSPDSFFYGGHTAILPPSSGIPPPFNTLRYFPSEETGCYSLPLSNAAYFIRFGFLYGNYDGLNSPPSFGLYVEGILMRIIGPSFLEWRTGIQPFFVEIMNFPTDSDLNFCFVVSEGVPFINSVQIAPLNESSYSSLNQSFLLTHYRFNVGDNRTTLLEKDGIEWESDASIFNGLNYASKSTNKVISPLKGPPEYVPSELYQSVRVGDPSEPIGYVFHIYSKSRVNRRLVRLYFVELDPTVRIGDRVFDIKIDKNKVFTGFDVLKRAGGRHFQAVMLSFYVSFDYLRSSPLVLRLVLTKADDSLHEPVLCGVEIFEIFKVFSTTAHLFKGFENDVNVRLEIKNKSKSKLLQSTKLASLIISCIGTFLVLYSLLFLIVYWRRQHRERISLLRTQILGSESLFHVEANRFGEREHEEYGRGEPIDTDELT